MERLLDFLLSWQASISTQPLSTCLHSCVGKPSRGSCKEGPQEFSCLATFIKIVSAQIWEDLQQLHIPRADLNETYTTTQIIIDFFIQLAYPFESGERAVQKCCWFCHSKTVGESWGKAQYPKTFTTCVIIFSISFTDTPVRTLDILRLLFPAFCGNECLWNASNTGFVSNKTQFWLNIKKVSLYQKIGRSG